MRPLALIALLLALSCNNTAPVAPSQEVLKQYSLVSLAYESTADSSYTDSLVSWNGNIYIQFGKASGKAEAPSDVRGVIRTVYRNGVVGLDTVYVLTAGEGEFRYTVDSLGVVTFQEGPAVWPIQNGAVLTDSSYSFDAKQCYDANCLSYVHLAFNFKRIQ